MNVGPWTMDEVPEGYRSQAEDLHMLAPCKINFFVLTDEEDGILHGFSDKPICLPDPDGEEGDMYWEAPQEICPEGYAYYDF